MGLQKQRVCKNSWLKSFCSHTIITKRQICSFPFLLLNSRNLQIPYYQHINLKTLEVSGLLEIRICKKQIQKYLIVMHCVSFNLLHLRSLKIMHFACHISRNLTMLHSINICILQKVFKNVLPFSKKSKFFKDTLLSFVLRIFIMKVRKEEAFMITITINFSSSKV